MMSEFQARYDLVGMTPESGDRCWECDVCARALVLSAGKETDVTALPPASLGQRPDTYTQVCICRQPKRRSKQSLNINDMIYLTFLCLSYLWPTVPSCQRTPPSAVPASPFIFPSLSHHRGWEVWGKQAARVGHAITMQHLSACVYLCVYLCEYMRTQLPERVCHWQKVGNISKSYCKYKGAGAVCARTRLWLFS